MPHIIRCGIVPRLVSLRCSFQHEIENALACTEVLTRALDGQVSTGVDMFCAEVRRCRPRSCVPTCEKTTWTLCRTLWFIAYGAFLLM